MRTLFSNRVHAGDLLAERIKHLELKGNVVVLGLPRGGVPVANQVARALKVPLDVFVVRKLGVPGHEEYAMGAIASGGVTVLNDETVRHLGIPSAEVQHVIDLERRELDRREALYVGEGGHAELQGMTVIVVDDGLATGATMNAAIQAIRKYQPERMIVAVPVASASAVEDLRPQVDDIICLYTPEPFWGVGAWYGDFSQTSDADVRHILDERRHHRSANCRPG